MIKALMPIPIMKYYATVLKNLNCKCEVIQRYVKILIKSSRQVADYSMHWLMSFIYHILHTYRI